MCEIMYVSYIIGLYLLCGYCILFRYDQLGIAVHCVSKADAKLDDAMHCVSMEDRKSVV